MSVNGIGQNYYQSNVSTHQYNKSKSGRFCLQEQPAEVSATEGARQNADVQDIYKGFKGRTLDESVLPDEESEQGDSQESETKTEIIVKPDGSRALVMTMSIGGMETTMSLEISKPTEIPNENVGNFKGIGSCIEEPLIKGEEQCK